MNAQIDLCCKTLHTYVVSSSQTFLRKLLATIYLHAGEIKHLMLRRLAADA